TLTNLTKGVVAPQFRSKTVAVRFPSAVTASLRIVFEQKPSRSQPVARQAPQARSATAVRPRIHRVAFIDLDASVLDANSVLTYLDLSRRGARGSRQGQLEGGRIGLAGVEGPRGGVTPVDLRRAD